MGATTDSLTRDFTWAVADALQTFAAERSGVPCPALLLKKAASARQAFPGSVLRLRDGSIAPHARILHADYAPADWEHVWARQNCVRY